MEAIARNMMTGRFTLNDMYAQMKAVKKMGALKKLVGLLPGMNKMEDKIDLDASQARLDQYKVIMDSMTMQEKDEPNLIKGKRIERIARGAGVSTSDVKELLKQYNNSKKMMGAVGKDRKMRKKMQKQFGAMDPEALKEFENSGGSE
jgi:signal recognition particle subunit SRP54